ncbi:MAG: prephenate dehydrogenase/arogenate dehydrogenase family protein [Candidatus Acidiferrales bacterium]
MTTLPFHRIAILGTGLIGGSFALAIRKQIPSVAIIGFDRSESAAQALTRGAIDKIAPDLATAVQGADLIYIAMPIAATIESLPQIAAAAKPGALITDACSTKTTVCKAAAEHFKNSARFLGGHPMAGKEHSGIENATADLFRGAPYALIATEADPDPRVKTFASLLAAIGAQPIHTDPETHDWAVSIVSHLPQLMSVALARARVVQDETDETGLPLSLSGPGLQDTLRLAGSPYTIWRDILLTNSTNISRALDRLAQAIDYLRTQLTSKEIQQEFDAANALYQLLRKQK